MWRIGRWRPCGAGFWQWLQPLTVSGPQFCPPRSASPARPSTPQTAHMKVASVGYFWGSPGGWKGDVWLGYIMGWHLHLPFVWFSSGALLIILPPAVPPPFLHLNTREVSLKQLPDNGQSEAIIWGAPSFRGMDLAFSHQNLGRMYSITFCQNLRS